MATQGTMSETPELIRKIRAKAEAESESRSRVYPLRVRLDLNVPVGTKRVLKRAAKRHSVTATQIILAALEETLPKLLGEDSGSLFEEKEAS
jgi:hypothetical protein